MIYNYFNSCDSGDWEILLLRQSSNVNKYIDAKLKRYAIKIDLGSSNYIILTSDLNLDLKNKVDSTCHILDQPGAAKNSASCTAYLNVATHEGVQASPVDL